MATSAITLDSFPLVGTTPGGGRASVQGFEVWLGGSESRSRSPRTGQNGAWSTPGRRAAKRMEIDGQIVYDTAADAAAERRAMLALGGHGSTQLVVTDSLAALGIMVEVDVAEIPPIRDSMLHFHFEVTATDPFARALDPVTVAVAAGATVPHSATGTAPAEIEVTTTSAGTVVLSIGGLTLRWGSLPSGAALTSGRGFTNPPRTCRGPSDENLFGLIVQPMQWPAIVPGSNSIVSSGTAALSVKYFPTYA